MLGRMHRVSDQGLPGPSYHLNDPLAIFYEYMYNLLFVQNRASQDLVTILIQSTLCNWKKMNLKL